MTSVRAFVREHPRAAGIGFGAAFLLVVVVAALTIGGLLSPDETGAVDATPTPTLEASPDESLEASPSPSSAEPSVDASPTTTHAGPYTLTDHSGPLYPTRWARVAVDELNVRRQPRVGAEVVGKLSRGDLVLVTGDYGGSDGEYLWAPISAAGFSGWAAERDEEDVYLQPIGTPWLFGSRRDFNGVVSNGSTFLAYGTASDLAAVPYEGSGVRPLAYLSNDGVTWTEVTNLHGNLWAADGSPDGFVVVAQPTYIEPTLIWLSEDGRTWDEPIPTSLNVPSAAFGPAGPVVVGMDYESGDVVVIHPAEPGAEASHIPSGDDITSAQLEGSSAGYVLFDRYGAVRILVSTDGVSWEPVDVPDLQRGRHAIKDVELIGRRVVVVATRARDGTTLIRQGEITDAGSIEWNPRTILSGLHDATVDSVSADPDGRLLAFGWNRDRLEPVVWTSTDGFFWENLGVAEDGLGGAIGPEPAFADGVWAAVTDTVYTSRDGATWTRRVDLVVQPGGPGCPAADEVTALDLVFLGGAAADCFGDEPLTFVAWAPLVDGLGGCCPPEGLPAWLNSAVPVTFLESAPRVGGGFGPTNLRVALAPGEVDRLPGDEWVEVTGHFFDPASAECRNVPLTTAPHRLESRAAVIDACQRRFVVTQVEVVDGPS